MVNYGTFMKELKISYVSLTWLDNFLRHFFLKLHPIVKGPEIVRSTRTLKFCDIL